MSRIERNGGTTRRFCGESDVGTPDTHISRADRVWCWLTLVFVCIMSVSSVHAQTFEWARSAGGTYWDRPDSIAVDSSGNVYITGEFRSDTATFGPFTLTNAGWTDAFMVKYDNSGNVLWAQSAGGADWDHGSGNAVDGFGNSYVTGSFRGTMTLGSSVLASAGSTDVYLVKFGSAGNVIWARSAGGSDEDWGVRVAVDVSGNVYLVGRFWGTATFGPFILTSSGYDDAFVVKYDSAGNVLWARSAGGADGDGTVDVAVDASGNVFLTGYFASWRDAVYHDSATFGPFTLTSAGSTDAFVAKYDSAGNVVWARSAGGSSSDFGLDLAVDSGGNTYVTGLFTGEAAMFGPLVRTANGRADVYVAKYSSVGDVLWVRSGGTVGSDNGKSIAVDGAGDSYVTGFLDSGFATFGPFSLTGGGNGDAFVVKYDSAGSVQWVRLLGGTGADDGRALAVDGAQSCYVTGAFVSETVTFGPFTLTNTSQDEEIFLAKLSDDPTGSCDPDADSDGIQDGVDPQPATYNGVPASFGDNSTVPVTTGLITDRGDQDLCVSDLGAGAGVMVKSLGGGAVPASVQIGCFYAGDYQLEVVAVGAGECFTAMCSAGPVLSIGNCSGATASRGGADGTGGIAAAGDLAVNLRANDVEVATVALPAGNLITYGADTLEVVAPTSNTSAVSVVSPTGQVQQDLAPGDQTVMTWAYPAGKLSGWGLNEYGQISVPSGRYIDVATGLEHGLGVRTDGTLVGWGGNSYGQINVPSGRFKAVAAGDQYSLAIRTDGTMAGWGKDHVGESVAPSGTFIAVAAGAVHSLAIRTDGTLHAWGDNTFGQLDVPTGTFTAIAAGQNHCLGIRSDGTLAGWGRNHLGQTNVPAGTFVAVAAGQNHSLAIRTDGTLVGWGDNGAGQTDVPSGTFKAIAAGRTHSLAIRTDGTLAGWGSNDFGETDVSSGVFTKIAARVLHSLAVRDTPDPAVATGEVAKTNRYLRFTAPSPAGVREEVIRVRADSMCSEGPAAGLPCDSSADCIPGVCYPAVELYAGPPFQAPEEDTSHPGLTFTAAPLQCEPYAHAWVLEGIVSVYGAEITPGRDFWVERANADCPNLLTDANCWSALLPLNTAKYGDLVPIFDGGGTAQPDFNDIAALVQKFLAAPGAPIKAVAQLQPNCVFPDRAINFKDIAAGVTAFIGTPTYEESYFGSCACPSSVICGLIGCGSDLQCGNGLCINGSCTDECGRCRP